MSETSQVGTAAHRAYEELHELAGDDGEVGEDFTMVHSEDDDGNIETARAEVPAAFAGDLERRATEIAAHTEGVTFVTADAPDGRHAVRFERA